MIKLGEEAAKKGELKEAVRLYSKVLHMEGEGERAGVYLKRAEVYLRQEKHSLALTDVDKALDLTPIDTSVEVHVHMYVPVCICTCIIICKLYCSIVVQEVFKVVNITIQEFKREVLMHKLL